jgi:hypothetical protein
LFGRGGFGFRRQLWRRLFVISFILLRLFQIVLVLVTLN